MFIRVFIAVLLVSAVYLQHKAWFSEVGFFRAHALRAEVAHQTERLARLEERNRILTAEVLAQKDGLAAVEARARSDLGMVREGETFYLVGAAADAGAAPAESSRR